MYLNTMNYDINNKANKCYQHLSASTKRTCSEAQMDFKKLPQLDYVRQILAYDPVNGGLTWLSRPREHFSKNYQHTRWNIHTAGTKAGCKRDNGYIMIRIDNELYCEHRLVWLHVNGEDPDSMIDHINGIPFDNRIENLRLANQSQQSRNTCGWNNKSVPYKGVFPVSGYETYFARIRVDGKYLYLGSFSNPKEAHNAYCDAAIKYYGKFANFGKRKKANG